MNETLTRELFDDPRGLRVPRMLVALSVAAAVTMAFGAWMAFVYAPTEAQMGFVQKIFYFHVPSAWMMLLSAPLMAVASVGYLINRKDSWDRWSDASVELAVLFGVLVLITGPLWGRKAWGTYWVWDARLTMSLVMVLTLIACKIVRTYAGSNAKQIAAGLAVLSVVNAVFVWKSVEIWQGTHPDQLTVKGKMHPDMYDAFWVCVLAFHLTYAALLWSRLRMGKLRTALDRLHMKAVEVGVE